MLIVSQLINTVWCGKMINDYTDRNWETSQYHSNDRYNFPKLQMKAFKSTLKDLKKWINTFSKPIVRAILGYLRGNYIELP